MSNEMATGGGNALMITQQYPTERFNLLVPMQTVAEIAEIHRPVMNVVQISTNLADKEIYEQEKAKRAWQDRLGNDHPATPAGYSLTKKGLNKLMRAAGIKILGTRPIIPSTCQKCAEVNRSIGRPVNCGACGNKDVKFEARISVPQLTGESIEIVAHKEIIVQDVTEGMSDAQRKEFLKFRSETCETKAINRALRAAMHIKGTYTMQELQKPFVVAYLVPNLDNERVKQEAIRHMFTSAQELYGGYNPEARKAIFVEDDVEDGMEYETPGKPITHSCAYQEAPQKPPRQVQQQQQQQQSVSQPPKPSPTKNTSHSQDYDKTRCAACGVEIPSAVSDYSIRYYKRPLCRDCQRKEPRQ